MTFNNKLIVKLPQITGDVIECPFIFNDITYVNKYHFPSPVPSYMQYSPLLGWLGVATSLGMFSLEYFTEVHCEFFLDNNEKQFFEKLLFQGLGEFRYTNGIPIDTGTTITSTDKRNPIFNHQVNDTNTNDKILLLNGGGKDGSTSAYLLSEAGLDFTWFQRGNSVAQSSVVKVWSKPAFVVKRHLDERRKGKFSGHRPISAGIAILSLFAAQSFGFRYVVTSNESSANEGNITIDGFTVNHQYSKSLEFENDLSALLKQHNVKQSYFSLLRPLNEVQIAKIFSSLTPKQMQAITSCNNGTSSGKWCLSCAKCAFVVLSLTATDPDAAELIFGYDAINNPDLLPFLGQLVDPSLTKPLECVGTDQECRVALALVNKQSGLTLSFGVRKLADTFAEKNKDVVNETMSSLEKHSIPAKFKPVVTLIKQHLS